MSETPAASPGARQALAWVAAYERAWRTGDVQAVGRLFTEDARYLVSPYAEPLVGLNAIRETWLSDQGREFTVTAEPVAVDGATAVIRVQVDYLTPHPQQYRDLWILRFAADGRVQRFEEWAYWPGASHTAAGD